MLAARMGGCSRLLRAVFLVGLPLCLVGPSLLPGQVFLPMHTAQFPPLAGTADPAVLAQALARGNPDVVDKISPILTDAEEAVAQVRSGRMPLWSPWHAGGMPLVSQYLSGLLYPPNTVLFLALGPADAYGWLALLSLVLAGWFTERFLRGVLEDDRAALAGGVFFALSGFVTANLHYTQKVDALMWLPAMLWAIECRRASGRWAGPALAAACGMALLAGFSQIAFFSLGVAGLWALCRRDLRALGFMVAGCALAAPQILPTWEAWSMSYRVDLGSAGIRDDAFGPGGLLGLLMPDALGAPEFGMAAGQRALPFLTHSAAMASRWNATENALYLGLIPLALAFVALRRGRGPVQRSFPALGALAAVLFACDPSWFPLDRIPPFGTGAPIRALAPFAFFGAWLAAAGLARVHARGAGPGRAVGLCLLGLSALGALAWLGTGAESLGDWIRASVEGRFGTDAAALQFSEPRAFLAAGERLHTAFGRLAVVGGVAAAAWAAFASLRGALPAFALLLAAGAGDLLAFGMPLNNALASDNLWTPDPDVAAVRTAAGTLRVARHGDDLGSVEGLLRPTLTGAYGIRDISAYNLFTSRHVTRVWRTFAETYLLWPAYVQRTYDLDHPILDASGVGVILSRDPLEPIVVEVEHLEPVVEKPGFHAYRRLNAMPRAWLVSGAVDGAEPKAMLDPDWNPRTTVFLANSNTRVLGPGYRPAALASDEPGRVVVALPDGDPGFLVLADAWWPGWKADVEMEDGTVRTVDPLRANVAFMAVPLEQGARLVTFRYTAPLIGLGLAVSLLTGAVLVWLGRRRGRP